MAWQQVHRGVWLASITTLFGMAWHACGCENCGEMQQYSFTMCMSLQQLQQDVGSSIVAPTHTCTNCWKWSSMHMSAAWCLKPCTCCGSGKNLACQLGHDTGHAFPCVYCWHHQLPCFVLPFLKSVMAAILVGAQKLLFL